MNAFVNATLRGLRYSFHVIVHPFDGFWDLKHEKRGNGKAAVVIILALVLTVILCTQLSGFIVNNTDPEKTNVLQQIISVLLPFFLWCLSNWCITTLVDGEGSLKDIMITTAYALVPLILLNVPLIFVSNIITVEEVPLYNLVLAISVLWSALLLFIGIMTVHQFTVMKTLSTILIALVGMLVIIFLAVLFASVLQMAASYIAFLYKELSMRW